MSEDVSFRHAVRERLEEMDGVDVRAHAVDAPRADVVVIDAETTSPTEDEQLAGGEPGLTIFVTREIDAEVRDRGRLVNAAAYVRKDDGLFAIIGLVIDLASCAS